MASKYLGVIASLQARFDLAAIATLDALTSVFAQYTEGNKASDDLSSTGSDTSSATSDGTTAKDVDSNFTRTPSAPVIPAFISGWAEYKTAVRAMLRHKSQMVWFRWLYVAFSRYMWVNEWFEVAV